MPEQNPDHRFARAAGKATRAFLDSSRQDQERLRQEKAQEKERERERETHRGTPSARPTEPSDAGRPVMVTIARWWWAVATVLFALLTASFIISGISMPAPAPGDDLLGGETGQFVLAGAAGILTLAAGTGTVQLLRSRRSASGLLTAVALVIGIPLIVRGHPLLITVAVVLLAGAILLWLPQVRRRLR
ncbi:hypothetical protein [Citricoccus sp. GCM10030269]|uniref:hypothetical protein n=1 Tax=Citricoccus sp. GCM10030269 TaxID=3273388 RepID=UPI00360F290E